MRRVVVTSVCASPPTGLTAMDGAEAVDALRSGVRELADAAVRLCGDARMDDALAYRTGCMLGTAYGSGHVIEKIVSTLATSGPRYLNPEDFLFHSPHGVTSSVCLAAGLGGLSATLAGLQGGSSAVLAAARALVAGRQAAMLAGAFEWPTPFGAGMLAAAGGAEEPSRLQGGYVLLLLEQAAIAAQRGADVLAELELGGTADERMGRDELAPSIRPLVVAVDMVHAGLGVMSLTDGVATASIRALSTEAVP